jgi:hypothetical protein
MSTLPISVPNNNEALAVLRAEGLGVVGIHIFRPADAPVLLADARAGDARAAAVLLEARRVTSAIATGGRYACIACDEPLRAPPVLIVIFPASSAASLCMVTTGCSCCGDDALVAGAERWLKLYWPNSRPIPAHRLSRTAGRA